MITFSSRVDTAAYALRSRIVLAGEFDVVARPAFDRSVALVELDGTVTVDLDEVTFMDAGGLHALVDLDRATRRVKGSTRLAHVAERTNWLLGIAALGDRFVIETGG